MVMEAEWAWAGEWDSSLAISGMNMDKPIALKRVIGFLVGEWALVSGESR